MRLRREMAACKTKILSYFLLFFTSTASLPTKPVCHIHREHLSTFKNGHNSHHFNCSVNSGDVASEIVWKVNGSIVKQSQGPLTSLGLSLNDKDASGTLRCEAKTQKCDFSCEAKLTDFPRITTTVHLYEAYVGDRLVVPCKTTGNPKPSLAWTKRNKSLPDPTMHQPIILKKSLDGLDLVFEKASIAHDDVYLCHAVNCLGEDTHYAVVMVLYHTVVQPPHVIPLTQTVTVKNGSKVILACSVENTPEKYTVLYWNHSGIRIQNSKRIKKKEKFSVKILQKKYKSERAVMSLAINHVTLKDAGMYTCGAVTHVGRDDAHVQLIVKG